MFGCDTIPVLWMTRAALIAPGDAYDAKEHLDELICVPPVMVANLLQARIEERYDVGVRFGDQYARYRERTWMFGPPWLWLALAGSLVLVLGIGAHG